MENRDASVVGLLEEVLGIKYAAVAVDMPIISDGESLKCSRVNDAIVPVYCLSESEFCNGLLDKTIEAKVIEGYRGIKIHPRILKISPDNAEILNVIDICKHLRIPVFICTVFLPPALSTNRNVEHLIRDYCEAAEGGTLVLLHGGFTNVLAVSEIVRRYENVLLDLSFTFIRYLNVFENYWPFLFETLDRRIVIGSDYPEYSPKRVLDEIGNIFQRHNIEMIKRENILYGNMERLFL